MKFSFIIAVLTLVSVAQASVIQELEPNNDINSAQQIPVTAFTLGYNPIIANSATLPWVTIEGTGDGSTRDFYSFVVPNSGMIASIFDIDNSSRFNPILTLYDSSGNEIAQNERMNNPTDPGSRSSGDAYLTHTFNTAGAYIIAVGDRMSGSPVGGIRNGGVYQVHISLGYTEAQLRAAYGMGDPHFKCSLLCS
ncbi:Hemolysin-type calcium-binding repeat (2 copies) [Seminavis robusta]|uniref:Hemolysin-type calcium-binding repeat (2 copies) n=1 Tax=Seminavis robusta TaxID=568900 RepID=A0A9N8EBY9_9STRA|nr:Hemolysin-type calcium-binding repeat (2 copies) [Seminavis robusta]|eukprot:Sro947_g223350.1 Hemolysin-type calcium-binding repeat (2 copies) (194) ;mRNA; f:1771-2489